MPPQEQQPLPPPTPPVAPVLPQPPVYQPPAPAGSKPAGRTRWLIIAAACLMAVLLAAAAWFFFIKDDKPTKDNEAGQSPDTADVRRVSWVEPANLPDTYKKTDDSFDVVKTFYYDDEATDCFIATDIAPWGTYSRYGKTPKTVALDLEGTEEEGVKITKNVPGPSYTIKDTDGKRSYTFDSMQLNKDLSVEDLDYNKELTVVAYKPFGVYAASISFTCKAETWEAQKGTLEALAKQFTVQTER